MLDVLLCLVCLAALCLFFASLRGVNSASAPLLALACAVLWFTAFGMLGLLQTGGWLFYAACLLLGGWAFFRRGGTALLKRLASPGLLLFFAGALVLGVWLCLLRPQLTGWDEYSFWGFAVKIAKTTGGMYPLADKGFPWTMTEYPALIMLSYFAQLFGAYAPWKIYWAYGLLYLACAAALLAPFGRRQWRVAVPLAVCGLALPFFFSVPYATVQPAATWLSAYADLPGGMLFGGCLCLYFSVRQSKNGALWQVLPPLAALAIVKENIMPVALVAAGVFTADVLVFGSRPGGMSPLAPPRPAAKRLPEAGRRAAWCLGFFAVVLVPFYAWKQYSLWANTLNPYRNGNLTSAVSATQGLLDAASQLLGRTAMTPEAQSAARQMLDGFLGRVAVEGGYETGTLKMSMAGTGLFTLLLIIAVFAAAVLLAKTAHRRVRIAMAGGLLLGGYAAFNLMLFVYYGYLRHNLGQEIADYIRYTAAYTAGFLLLGLMLLGLCAKWGTPRRGLLARTALLALACFMVFRSAAFLRPGYSVLDMPQSAFAAEHERQAQSARVAAAIQPGGRVFFVYQGGQGGEYFQWHYDLFPIVVDYSITGGNTLQPPPPGTSEYDMVHYASLATLTAYLAETGCDYILIAAIDEGFAENYGSLFADLDPAAAPALYRLGADGLYARMEV